MSKSASPLRYPGGKAALTDLISSILHKNALDSGHYAEPFAGGSGLALSLLFDGAVGEVHLNDIDPGISSLWHRIVNDTTNLVEQIRSTPVTIEEWHRQREIVRSPSAARSDLAFATLFLNRTNRSGIIKGAGVIGGLQQDGNYLLDCRFNKDEIIRRINRIARYRSRIHLTDQDARDFLQSCERDLPSRSLICADPPYFVKGSNLYTSFYNPEDHADLAKTILGLQTPWVTTYDRVDEIEKLYRQRRMFSFSVQYSVQTKRTACELMVVSKGLKVPRSLRDRQIKACSMKTGAA